MILHGKKLPRLLAYGLGVLGADGSVHGMVDGTRQPGDCDYAVGGHLRRRSGSGLLYLFDWVVNLVWARHECEQRERLLQEQLDGKSKPA